MKFLILVGCYFLSSFAFAGYHQKTINDSHTDFDTQEYCKLAFLKDVNAVELIQANIRNDNENLYIQLQVKGSTFKGLSYKEYFLWVDTNPSTQKGYVPYFETKNVDLQNTSNWMRNNYQAWNNFYADYKVFISKGQDQENNYNYFFQSCKSSNCTSLSGAQNAYQAGLDIDIDPSSLTYIIPLKKINVGPQNKIEIGITSYYDHSHYGACSGEDDIPNWGNNAISYTLN